MIGAEDAPYEGMRHTLALLLLLLFTTGDLAAAPLTPQNTTPVYAARTAYQPRTQPPKLTRQRFFALARDPAHNGKITKGSRREATVGIRLERMGLLPGQIRRESTGSAEFVDGKGRLWDVKGFRSNFPPERGGFVLKRAVKKLMGQFQSGENVILDTKHLSTEHTTQLKTTIKQRGWSDRVLWYPQ